MVAVGVSSVAVGQPKVSKDPEVEAQVIALEKAGWEAWKNKDAGWFQNNLTDEFLQVNSDAVSTKAEVVRSTATDCDVKNVSLDNFRFVMLDKDAVLLTYTAMQEGTCGGQRIPQHVRATVNYVKRGGRWLEAMYMEAPMAATTRRGDERKTRNICTASGGRERIRLHPRDAYRR